MNARTDRTDVSAAPTTTNHERGARRARQRAARLLLAIALASIVLGLVWDALFGQIIPLDPEAIRSWLAAQGLWAPVLFIGLMTAAVVVSPIPSVPLDIAAGLAFGLLWGTVYTVIGAELGAIIAFGVARRLGRPWLVRWVPDDAVRRVDDLAARYGAIAILVMRLVPTFNFDWVSYGAGVTALSFRTFAVATLVGMIPPVIAIVAVGATLVEHPAIAAGIFAALAVVALLPLAVAALPARWEPRLRRHTRRKEGTDR